MRVCVKREREKQKEMGGRRRKKGKDRQTDRMS